MEIKPWKKLKEEKYNAGYRKIIKKTFELPTGKTADFDIVDGGDVVCVLALTKEKKIILAKQFRQGQEKVLLELPGGGLLEKENPEEAMTRELLEETGYKGNLNFIGTSFSDAYMKRVRSHFVATDCVKIQEPKYEETEFTEGVELTLEDFMKHLHKGELTDGETAYRGLEYLGLLR
ncbi:MAG: NUDIX hydrolase [Patescibacteria group bacterium]